MSINVVKRLITFSIIIALLLLTTTGCNAHRVLVDPGIGPEITLDFAAPGYPFPGINPNRDNRSQHVGPDDLQNVEISFLGSFLEEVVDFDDRYSRGVMLTVNEDGYYYYSIRQYGYDSYETEYTKSSKSAKNDWLYVISPEGVPISHVRGGNKVILGENGLITYGYHQSESRHSLKHGQGSAYAYAYSDYYFIYSYTLGLDEYTNYGGHTLTMKDMYIYSETRIPFNTPIAVLDLIPIGYGYILSLEQQIKDDYCKWERFPKITIRNEYTLEPSSFHGEIQLGEEDIPIGAASDYYGRIYCTISGDNPRVICVDRYLNTIWEADIQTPIAAPVINREGITFVATKSNVIGFARDGRLLWKANILGNPNFALTLDGDLLTVTSVSHELIKVAAPTGKILWGTPIDYTDEIAGLIVDAEGKIIVGTDKRLYILDPKGRELDSINVTVPGYTGDKQTCATNLVIDPNGTLAQIWYVDNTHHLVQFYH